MAHHPIAEHAFLSDCHSAALVMADGTIDWLCFPRFDSPSVFAALLDEAAGHWRVGAVGITEIGRRYLDRTLVLETTQRTAGGTLTLTDALAVDSGGHELGKDPPHVLLRRAACTAGAVEVELDFAPRPEYGLARPLLSSVEGRVVTRGGPNNLALSSSVPLELDDSRVTARFHLEAGDDACFALRWSRSWEPSEGRWAVEDVPGEIDATLDAWRSWSTQHQRYEGPWKELVDLSGRVLQGLTFEPTGAIVAAATTSLPEIVGGSWNWDYRYAWIRDASLTLDALWVAACPDEAHRFLDWLVTAAADDLRSGGNLQIMYGVGGERHLPEIELAHLSGWRGSRPVRIGNAAWQQRQFDVYGEILDAVHQLRAQLGELDGPTRRFLVDVADAAVRDWRKTGHGIWEIRGDPQHYTFGKLMCWVALDRALDLADWFEAADHVEDWRKARDEIRAAILQQAWNPDLGAFTQAFGSEALDASVLMLPLTGFLSARDKRVRATVRAIEAGLTDERGLVCRFRSGQGDVVSDEGSFLICTFWLAQVHALAGEVEQAREVFERAVRYRNDLGLLAEQVDAATGELLGNFPQAFSHVGLVTAAWAISQAELGRGEDASREATRGG